MAKKKGKKAKHVFYQDPNEKHKPGCLTSHETKYKDGDACSYRWQGVKKAEANSGPYNRHKKLYARIGGEGHATKGFAQLFSSGVKNFHNGYMPYANQVHHVLPKATLKDAVEQSVKDATQIETVRDGLLHQEYNINYIENMLILAVKWRDACQIGLPTHCGDHPTYSATIKAKTMKALKPYASLFDEENHEAPDFLDLRDDLEGISTTTYKQIVSYGEATILGTCDATEISVNDVELFGV